MFSPSDGMNNDVSLSSGRGVICRIQKACWIQQICPIKQIKFFGPNKLAGPNKFAGPSKFVEPKNFVGSLILLTKILLECYEKSLDNSK